nr:hypothetical protein [Tanacetum cinerariifolium]
MANPNQVGQNAVQNSGTQNVRNQNGLIVVPVITNQNATQNRNGKVVAARAEGHGNRNNRNHVRCYNCREMGHFARNCTIRSRIRDVAYLQSRLLIPKKEEARIQLQAKKFDLMPAARDIDEIKKVNANCILMENLQQASTSGTQTIKSPIYDSNRSAEPRMLGLLGVSGGSRREWDVCLVNLQLWSLGLTGTCKAILSDAENRPPMLEKDMYDSWRSRMELYMLNRQHGRMILESVEPSPLLWPSVTEDGATRLKKYSELSSAEATQADCDVKATNIILQALPPEIYALVCTHKVAKDLWERIQMLMQGTSLTKQERECKLYDAFDKFAYQKGETLRDFYLRFLLLLNDMNMYNMKLEQFQVNTKFLNTLPPEWSKFVTNVKLQATVNDGRVTIQLIQGRQNHMSAGSSRSFASGSGGTSGRQRVIVCYNYKGEGHMAKQCTKPKRKRDAEWFKDKVLLVQAQANGQASTSYDHSLEIKTLKHTLSEHLKEKEYVTQKITLLKNDFQKEESKNIDRELALEKQALGFQNPCYLKKAQQLKQKLYDGCVIEKSEAIMVPDTEETLMLAEESHFETRFVPQTESSAEQAFWSQYSVQTDEPNLSEYHRVCDMRHASALDFASQVSQTSAILVAIKVETENSLDEFLENKAIEQGAGPNWLFDIDSLTKSMSYVPVDAGTNSTNLLGTKDAANQELKKNKSSLRYIVLPNWAHDALLESTSSKLYEESSSQVPEGSGNPNPTAFAFNPLADQMETLTVESLIPTVSSPVLTTCLNDSSEPSSEARLVSKRVANQEETPSLDNI